MNVSAPKDAALSWLSSVVRGWADVPSAILKEELVIRDLRESDFPALTGEDELWGIREVPGFMKWFHDYHPEHRLSRVATVNGKIVGFYVNTPCRLKVGEQTVVVFRGAIGVHPEHRSKPYNLFVLLVKAVHEEIARKNCAIYGFPIPALVRYYTRKVGFRAMKTVSSYVRGLGSASTRAFLLWKRSVFLHQRVRVQEIDSFGEPFNRLWGTASREHPVAIVRDQEYLNWRHCCFPGEKNLLFAAEEYGRLAGYMALKITDKEGSRLGEIIDLFGVRRRAVTEALLLKALETFRRRGLVRAECRLLNGYYENALQSFGFSRKEEPGQGNLMIAKCYAPDVQGHFYSPEKWLLTKADILFS